MKRIILLLLAAACFTAGYSQSKVVVRKTTKTPAAVSKTKKASTTSKATSKATAAAGAKAKAEKQKAEAERQAAAARTAAIKAVADEIVGNMVKVDGGTFKMGENDNSHNVAHDVTLSSYYINKFEVTQKEWVAVMDTNPSRYNIGDDRPVEYVSWNDIQVFIGKLNAAAGTKLRLPTEAEWEFAAIGGNKRRGYEYSGSNDVDEVAWYEGNSRGVSHGVGKLAPNELGLYDMTGNVWEYCNDWYSDFNNRPAVNPQGIDYGDRRVMRGGAYNDDTGKINTLRLKCRVSEGPDERVITHGFRLAM